MSGLSFRFSDSLGRTSFHRRTETKDTQLTLVWNDFGFLKYLAFLASASSESFALHYLSPVLG
jgi:hypothetical protein